MSGSLSTQGILALGLRNKYTAAFSFLCILCGNASQKVKRHHGEVNFSE